MKADSTIRKQIARLRAIVQDDSFPLATRDRAYEAWHALIWVRETVRWTPAGALTVPHQTKAQFTEIGKH